MRLSITAAALLAACFAATLARAQTCAFEPWIEFRGDRLLRNADADAWTARADGMKIDADGAPNAYGPQNSGLDLTANAGWPDTSWWDSVLVPDPQDPSRPYVQPDGPFAGFYVTKTSLFDPSKADTDTAKWVDATTVPYFVFPTGFGALSGTGRMGDFGLAVNLRSGESAAFIVADSGGGAEARLGEVSIALAEALGGENVNPRNGAGAPQGPFAYVVFRLSSSPDRARRWPVAQAAIEAEVARRVGALGGVATVTSCFP